jgi:hypothetical protein
MKMLFVCFLLRFADMATADTRFHQIHNNGRVQLDLEYNFHGAVEASEQRDLLQLGHVRLGFD